MGQPPARPTNLYRPIQSDASGPNNNLYVVWSDTSAGNAEIYLRRWDGNSWSDFGASASGGGISATAGESKEPSLVTAASGTPFVGWQETTATDNDVYVRLLAGTAWAEAGSGAATGGGISGNGGESNFPALAFTTDGRLFAAWEDNSNGNYEIYVLMNSDPE